MGPFTVPWLASRKCESLFGQLFATEAQFRTLLMLLSRAAQKVSNGWTLSPARFPSIGKNARHDHQACRTALLNGYTNLTSPPTVTLQI